MTRRNLRWILVIAAISVLCYEKAGSTQRSRYGPMVTALFETLDQIDRNYVEQVGDRELFEGAMAGLLDKLDEHSAYFGPEQYSDLLQDLDQQFGGIGIQVSLPKESEQLTVLSPLLGTPAYDAGILAGDVILAVDGKSTEGLKLEDAVRLLRGKPGDSVRLTVRHEGAEDSIELAMERALIHVDTVLGDLRNADDSWSFFLEGEDRLGYVRLTSFSEDTVEELKAALAWLAEREVQGLVLDVRNNAGGLLQAAVETSDLFIDEGRIVSTRGRGGVPLDEYNAESAETYSDFPVVVLANRYSASASEIVAACLQDHARAIVVGERTWGKGSVQNIIELERGKSALKLTTATYWRPSGRNIHRLKDATETDDWGVLPSDGYEVKLDDEEFRELLRYRRARDVIKSSNHVGVDATSGATSGEPSTDESTDTEPFVDRQLQTAVEYLHDAVKQDSSVVRAS